MAVTIVVLSGSQPDQAELSLTLDSPRVVIGRGDGCEVRLPDASVSQRHASLRQRGGEYVILDEGSKNGTFHGPVRLPPQTPRVVKSGERVRVGRVWLELRMAPAVVSGSTAAAARELAISLVARGLAAQGEDPGPRLIVLDGADRGAVLALDDPQGRYSLAPADADLIVPELGKRRLTLSRKGDSLLLHAEGAGAPLALDDVPLASSEATWRVGQVLHVGRTAIAYDYPAAAALAELEKGPEEVMRDDEAPSPPAGAVESEDDPPADEAAPPEATPTPAPAGPIALRRKPAADAGGWSMLDSAVVIFAVSVLALSVAGGFWLLGR